MFDCGEFVDSDDRPNPVLRFRGVCAVRGEPAFSSNLRKKQPLERSGWPRFAGFVHRSTLVTTGHRVAVGARASVTSHNSPSSHAPSAPIVMPTFVRRRPPLLCMAVIVGILGLVSGCATGPVDLNSQTADRLQALVVVVATDAAANDFAGAATTLDQLQKQLDGAAARGDVSSARHLQIQKSIDQVRADLLATISPPAQSSTPSPLPAPSAIPGTDEGATPSTDPTPSNKQGPDKSKNSENSGKSNGDHK
jgi:hypothetical protein